MGVVVLVLGALLTGGVVFAVAFKLHRADRALAWLALMLGATAHVALTALASTLLWRNQRSTAGWALLAGSALITLATFKPVARVVTMVVRHSPLVTWETDDLPPPSENATTDDREP
ncbi:MAG: hypothetical protein AB2A00_20975 [Myxococcota bacterium]